MRVTFVAATDATVVRFVAGVDVHVLLPVGAVGESTIAAIKLTSERFLT